jgi:hypothetical protein
VPFTASVSSTPLRWGQILVCLVPSRPMSWRDMDEIQIADLDFVVATAYDAFVAASSALWRGYDHPCSSMARSPATLLHHSGVYLHATYVVRARLHLTLPWTTAQSQSRVKGSSPPMRLLGTT